MKRVGSQERSQINKALHFILHILAGENNSWNFWSLFYTKSKQNEIKTLFIYRRKIISKFVDLQKSSWKRIQIKEAKIRLRSRSFASGAVRGKESGICINDFFLYERSLCCIASFRFCFIFVAIWIYCILEVCLLTETIILSCIHKTKIG